MRWLECYLNNRSFSVKVNNVFSVERSIPSGVFQGSVLGPLLFSIYAADLPDNLPEGVFIKLFADDIKIYCKFTKENLEQMTSRIQAAIDALENWSKLWGLEFAPEKCVVVHIGHSNPKVNYKLRGCDIPKQNETRDLGIMVNSKLSNKSTITQRASKGFRALYSLFRAIKLSDPVTLLRCYKTYVLPVLEFASPVWSPSTKKDIESIEKIQKVFTKIVYARNHIEIPCYQKRCEELGLHSLQKRRIVHDLSIAFKILKGKSHLRCCKFFQFRVGYGRNSAAKFHIRKFRTEFRRHSFSLRCSKWLSKLPPEILSSDSPKSFKKNLFALDERFFE